jgi:thiol-disulfide isomerase/thioredoxin
MSDNLLYRRRILLYLGLGMAGATGVAAAGLRHNPGGELLGQATHSNRSSAANQVAVAPAESIAIPEFQGISQWLNSNPLTVADLKGSVTLIQFWTFACINCQRTLPYVTRWHQDYAAKGLKVIGVHTPEFAFERDVNNIRAALEEHNITYAVPLDNDYKTWSAYKNQFWPHLFLADRQGLIRYDHIGEGAYDETEQTIRQLLG